MKLYTVTYYDDGSSYNEDALPTLCGVFESRELAQAFCDDRFSKERWGNDKLDYEIEEITLNQILF
jgi:hypothetical protein